MCVLVSASPVALDDLELRGGEFLVALPSELAAAAVPAVSLAVALPRLQQALRRHLSAASREIENAFQVNVSRSRTSNCCLLGPAPRSFSLLFA